MFPEHVTGIKTLFTIFLLSIIYTCVFLYHILINNKIVNIIYIYNIIINISLEFLSVDLYDNVIYL
jgi:hypothetical protein